MDDPDHVLSGGGPAPPAWLVGLAWQLRRGGPVDPGDDTDDGHRADSSGGFRRRLPTLPIPAGLPAGGADDEPFDPDPQGGLGRLGDFRLLREVGRGGMGVVYEAVQVSLNRRVALKVLPFAAALDARQLARFQLEAQAAAGLHHNHIVPVFATGSERGVPYYAMQFIEGWDLAEVIRGGSRGPRPADERDRARAAAGLGRQAAEALEFAHRNEVLHRDIKPSNLLLDARGKLWITDFGLARVRGESHLTPTGETPGTPRYMSPEQALGRRAAQDGRSDLYALGATLYEFLTGEPAFAGDDRLELLRRIAYEEPAPPRRVNPAVPVDLETVVLKAMAKDPDDRYPTARALADDLGRFLDGRPVLARRPTPLGRAARWARRHQGAAAGGAAAAVVFAVALAAAASWSNAWLRRHNTRLEWEIARADLHAREAEARRRVAVDRQRLADRHLYAADLRLACQALAAGQFERAQDLLRDAAAAHAGAGPRGFAWDYLRGEARREVVSLPGVGAKAHSFAVAPDGRSLALADVEGSLRLWDLAAETPLPPLNAPGAHASDPAFSPDGRLLAALEVDVPGAARGVAVWESATGRLLYRLGPRRGGKASRLAFLDGGRALGVESAMPDGTRSLQLYRPGPDPAKSPRPVAAFDGLGAAAAPAGGGAVLTVEGEEWAVRDPGTGAARATVRGDFAGAGPWALSTDGRALAGAVPGRGVVRWDAGTGAETGRAAVDGRPAALEFSPDGSTLAAVDAAGRVLLFGRGGGPPIPLRADDLDRRRRVRVVFSPDGSRLATSPQGSPGGQQPVALWDAATGRKLATFPGRADTVEALAFAPDGRSLYLEGGASVRRWRPADGGPARPRGPAGHAGEAWSLAVSPDGLSVASGCDDESDHDTVKVWGAADGRPVAAWKAHGATVAALAYSPDGRLLATAALDVSDNLRLWDASTRLLLAGLPGHTDRVRSVAFSPGGRLLASAGSDGTVRLWDVAGRRARSVLTGHVGAVHQVAFSPDGSTLASAGGDGTVRLWDASAGSRLRTVRVGTRVSGVAFSPDGRTLAAADRSGHVTLWDLSGVAPVRVIRAEGEGLRCLAFSPDGLDLAAAGESRAVRLFDLETGQEVLTLLGHERTVNSLAFSPDGRLLASCSHDGAVRFWRADAP